MVADISDPLVVATSAQGSRDPAFRIRLELPGDALAAHGLVLDLLPLFSAEQAGRFRVEGLARKAQILTRARARLRRELKELRHAAPTVIVQRQVDLAPSLALERAATAGRRLIYDVDDAVWLSGRQTAGHYLGILKGGARKVRWLAERADHVIAGSEILAEHLSRYNDTVTVVPSLIDPTTHVVREHIQDTSVTLGWIGSPTTAVYLGRLVPVLERFAAQSSRPVRLLVVGGAAPRPAGVEVCELTWSPEAERAALADMDIGLMPLEDTLWSRGKCAYKALQYMACGIPPIVDDVGISAGVVAGAGYVAASDTQWLEGLHALAGDPSLRTRLAKVGRGRIEEDYSFERWIPVMASILRGD